MAQSGFRYQTPRAEASWLVRQSAQGITRLLCWCNWDAVLLINCPTATLLRDKINTAQTEETPSSPGLGSNVAASVVLVERVGIQ